MTTPEKKAQTDIMVDTCEQVSWFRNNVGVACFRGSVVRFGVGGTGGSDLIGIVRGTGRFIACEVKAPRGKTTPEQDRFLELVRACGGIAVVARCPEDVLRAIELDNERRRASSDNTGVDIGQ